MAELILAYHKDDKEIAGLIEASMKNKGHQIVLDEAPFDTSPLKEQWSSKHPKAKMVTVLITKKMASYLAESFGSASEDPLGTLNADEITIGVLPLVIEDVEMPAIF